MSVDDLSDWLDAVTEAAGREREAIEAETEKIKRH
jgi:hypothetical protein